MVLNSAFLFIKPEAVNDKVKAFVEPILKEKGLKIIKKGELKSEVIDKKKLIDNHYYAIASKATILKPKELNVPADKFKGQFGLEWQAALDSGKVFNALDGCEYFGVDAAGMSALWSETKKANRLIKFGGGFYCGDVHKDDKKAYVFNGFFMDMRAGYVMPGKSIYYYVVNWDPKKLSWGEFREKVCGATDPATADKGSIRGQIFAKWKDLDLAKEPNVGENSLHASASPFEGLSERMNWLGFKAEKDVFGAPLLETGLPMKVLKEWCKDPQVKIDASGKMGSCYDALEDIDADAELEKIKGLWNLNRPPVVGRHSGIEYDFSNPYAKLLDGKAECTKIIDDSKILAFLEPSNGHVIVISKAKGFPTLLDMPSGPQAQLMQDLPKLAKALKLATGSKHVNICTMEGDKSHVNHPHFHLVPEGAKSLSADAVKDHAAKIDLALHPPVPLKKAKHHIIAKINPEDKGLNLCVKVMSDTVEKELKVGKAYEVQVGDATGVITVTLKDDQKDLLKKGKTYELRNALTKMVKGHVMLTVDKWGKIEAAETEISEVKTDKDISEVEYELKT
jgi:diadenosine tetraphosphate (Ap4A) HIT family hydrolase/nucleoside diphosphate kinase